MALVINATPRDPAANSYLTVDEATAILAGRFGNDAWVSADPDVQAQALVQATEDIDTNRFRNYKSTWTQSLQFPRFLQDQPIDQIPPEIKRATAAQALFVLQNQVTGGRSQRQQMLADGVRQFTIGNLTEQLHQEGVYTGCCGEARKFLRGWIHKGGNLVSNREVEQSNRVWWPFI
jgi:hypothetical protein